MNHAQRITAATLAALTVITLSGCVWEPDNPNEGTGLHYKEFTTKDGRRISCAVYRGYSSAGLSCDWAFNSYLFSIFSYLIMIFSFRCMVYWNTWDY